MVSSFLPLLLSVLLATATLPELFQKAKTQFKLGAYGDALATLSELDSESAKPGFETQRQAVLPGLLFYKGASLAALGKSAEAEEIFEAFLALKPGSQLDPAVYPKSVVTALETARKTVEDRSGANRPEETGVIANAYRAFIPPTGHADESARENWADGPVHWLLTAEEKRSFADAPDPISRSEMIATFWRGRDPKPETPENEFREEFDKRVAFADVRFAQDEIRGSLTDRGMVFILLGPPTYSGRRPLKTGDDAADASGLSRYTPSEIRAASQPAGSNAEREARQGQVSGPGTSILDAAANWIEAWHYERVSLPKEIPNQSLEFDFVTKVGYGKNVLQRDQAILTALDRSRGIPKKTS
jgi:GWxTD domain-containing protein